MRLVIKSHILLFIALFTLMSMAQMGHVYAVDEAILKKDLRLTIPKARVTQVIDAQTLIINNTTPLHLPAIYVPWQEFDNPGEYGERAKKFLEREFLDKFVRIYQVRNNERAQRNALGHTEAYLVRADDSFFAQEEMLKQGLAFAYPSQSHYVLAGLLYGAEKKGRSDKIGFWVEKPWEILTKETAVGEENRFAVIEGEVRKVAARNNTIYLNFGDDWREDMTVALSSSLRRDFAKDGINLMQLGGQKIRARGWLRDYNGPFMEVFHPSQVEIVVSN